MKRKPVLLRAVARQDLEQALAYYLNEATPRTALGFITDAERAMAQLARAATAGSTRYAHELAIPGLRTWALRRDPYVIFYVERADHVDVWRILHAARDIPAWLQEPESG
jgi:toxin ParE1/3/4